MKRNICRKCKHYYKTYTDELEAEKCSKNNGWAIYEIQHCNGFEEVENDNIK